MFISTCRTGFPDLVLKASQKAVLSIVVIVIVIAGGFAAYRYFLQPPAEKGVLVLSTTSSTYDTGLLDYLLPYFEQQYNVQVKVLSLGTGQAIQVAQRGDADVVLVHAITLELPFVNAGYGVHRVGVMYNDFIIIGPKEDPAGIFGSTNASYAFQRILLAAAAGNATFISRADKSGTNVKELSIWTSIGVQPSNKTYSWYLQAGATMGTVLRMTNEKKAYTLTDRGTWLAFKDELTNLEVMTQGDKILLNPYAVIPVNGTRFPERNYRMAVTFAKFLISNQGQQLIANFTKGGQSLFVPIARNYTAAHSLGFPTQEQEVAWYDSVNVTTLVMAHAPTLSNERKSARVSWPA